MAGSSGRYVKTKSSNPFFDDDDIEDVDDETFLKKAPSRPKSSFSLGGNIGYKYSNFSNTQSTGQERASRKDDYDLESPSREEDRRQLLLLEKQRIERETVESSRRALGLLHESEQVGASTAEELLRQREQLERTERRLDDTNNTLRASEKHIQNIKSVFSSIKNYFSKGNEPVKLSSGGSGTSIPAAGSSSHLSKVLEDTKTPSDAKPSGTHPGLRIRGFADDEEDVKRTSSAVDEELDDNLGLMSDSLARLKGLAQGLNTELDSQNSLIDRVQVKADKVDWKVQRQNKDMQRLLKK